MRIFINLPRWIVLKNFLKLINMIMAGGFLFLTPAMTRRNARLASYSSTRPEVVLVCS